MQLLPPSRAWLCHTMHAWIHGSTPYHAYSQYTAAGLPAAERWFVVIADKCSKHHMCLLCTAIPYLLLAILMVPGIALCMTLCVALSITLYVPLCVPLCPGVDEGFAGVGSCHTAHTTHTTHHSFTLPCGCWDPFLSH